MSDNVKVFESADALANEFTNEVLRLIVESSTKKERVNIMLSGGNTPAIFFRKLAEMSDKNTDFDFVHFFWGDERCVPHSDSESNYGVAKLLLFDKISISEVNIHPMFVGLNIEQELLRNENEISKIPVFDLVMLGMGDDGHTASIFPDNMKMFNEVSYCTSAFHPVTGQQRITVTPHFLIHKTQSIVFLVTGKNKAEILGKVFSGMEESVEKLPTAKIRDKCNNIKWLLDKDAAQQL